MKNKKEEKNINKSYDHLKIEKKWQKFWDENKVYKTLDAKSANSKKLKPCYVLDMFPYPSGAGLHVGHPRGYIGSDVYARMKRMQGYNVLHPMGYDAFGLPAEQYAIEHKIHPKAAVEVNVKTFEKQLSIIGLSYDWSRRINTTDPEYYKWTQWIFLQLFNSYYDTKKNKALSIDILIKTFEKEGNKNIQSWGNQKDIFSKDDWKKFTAIEKQNILMNYRLAFEIESEVNWCPKLGTVLANDEIVDDKDGKQVSERGGYPVEKMLINQWSMRITAYADRLLSGLENLEWADSIKEIQKNWIGKSEGLVFTAPVKDLGFNIQTFSAHFEACYADTFVAIAPDHPILEKLISDVKNKNEILKKCKEIIKNRENDLNQTSDGIFTGRYIVDPLGNGDLPIWVASFALANYGTGIVKCSCHDERDFKFAKKFNIQMKPVLFPTDPILKEKVKNLELCFSDSNNGVLLEPKEFNGKNAHSVRKEISDFLIKAGFAERKITYKMRDAIFARQRYWGEPIPLYRDKNGLIHEVKKLPLELPKVSSYEPTGRAESPLAGVASWKKSGYETNTMPGWAGSSWYFLRYMDPQNKKSLAGDKEIEYWKNVDMYIGGAEHATGHLLYSRFWHKFLYDIGITKTQEPFKKMHNQGMIGGPDGRKMSKRWGNVINPDDIVKTYGADTLRVYEMFLGPFDSHLPWNTESIMGSRRFIERVWRAGMHVMTEKKQTNIDIVYALQDLIKKIESDIVQFKFNTAISGMMIFIGLVEDKNYEISNEDFLIFVKLLAPFAPHITDEIFQNFLPTSKQQQTNSIHLNSWPKAKKLKIRIVRQKIAVQFNGKLRGEIMVLPDSEQSTIVGMIHMDDKYHKYFNQGELVRTIYVPNKIINFVIKNKN